MRHSLWMCALLLGAGLPGADDEGAFLHLLSRDQLNLWSGDREFWLVEEEAIRTRGTRSTPLVYDGRSYKEYVLRFTAQVEKGSLVILLRNTPTAWRLSIDTERVQVGESTEFFNKSGELADYEVQVRGRGVSLLRNGQHSAYDYVSAHVPESGKLSLLAAPSSDFVVRNVRVHALP